MAVGREGSGTATRRPLEESDRGARVGSTPLVVGAREGSGTATRTPLEVCVRGASVGSAAPLVAAREGSGVVAHMPLGVDERGAGGRVGPRGGCALVVGGRGSAAWAALAAARSSLKLTLRPIGAEGVAGFGTATRTPLVVADRGGALGSAARGGSV